MARRSGNRREDRPAVTAPDLLSELRRLYAQGGAVSDVFGRRQALASEVERTLKHPARSERPPESQA